MQNSQNLMSTLLPLVIVFVVVLLRMRRMSGVRPMRLQSLWIRPAIVTIVAALLVYNAPPHGAVQVLILLGALAIGALLGWHQGKLMEISVDAATGGLQVRASMWAVAAFLALVLLRVALRPWLTGAASPVHAYVGMVTDGFLLFFVGLASARAAEMFIRGRALVAAAEM